MSRETLDDRGTTRLALQLFKDDGAKAKDEARSLVKHYRNGAGARQVMLLIREAKERMGIRAKQGRLEGV